MLCLWKRFVCPHSSKKMDVKGESREKVQVNHAKVCTLSISISKSIEVPTAIVLGTPGINASEASTCSAPGVQNCAKSAEATTLCKSFRHHERQARGDLH